MIKRVFLSAVALVALIVFSFTPSNAASNSPNSTCWQDSCNSQFYYTPSNCRGNYWYQNSVYLYDSTDTQIGILALQKSGATHGCMAEWANVTLSVGEVITNVTLITRSTTENGSWSDGDECCTAYNVQATYSSVEGVGYGKMLGYEGHSEDCVTPEIKYTDAQGGVWDATGVTDCSA